MKVPERVRAEFRRPGRRGGRARARRLGPEVRTSIARRAAVQRWTQARFGVARYADLGLPGGALVDQGLRDLADGRETDAGLLVALAAPRLQREGVPVPNVRIPDADRRLYRLLTRTEGLLAHARYLARLEQVASFADACRRVRRRLVPRAR